MKKLCLLFFSICLVINLCSQQLLAQPSALQRPKLVVGIVVDQMRWDYLYRYYDRYGNDGFKRMLSEGFSCENTFISHLPSYTAVGHSTIFTGSVPAIHGIVGNDWIDQLTGRAWYCTEDTTVQTVGASDHVGEMSPRNLLASTITDELKLASNFRSKVVGVSLKDRASILPAGHAADGAFWFDDAAGSFVTSSYYMNDLPQWAKDFNAKNEPEKLVANNWNTLYPLNTYQESTSDNVSWEGKFKGEQATTFPHPLASIYKASHGSIRTTPFGNQLTLDFAEAAVTGYALGQGKATDFLTINCASTDYVGHQYGPNSIEVEDTYLRLDRQLAAFFHFLDQKVGKGNYLVFLSADHGAAHSIGFMEAHHIPAGYLDFSPLAKNLNALLEKQFGISGLVREITNYQVNFDLSKIADHQMDIDTIKKVSIDFLQKQPGVEFAIDISHIGESAVPEPLKTMIINGYQFKRSGQIQIVNDPGWIEGHTGGTGTTHGTWNPYDTHIPLLFMGWGIHHGTTNQTVHMTDIAPTVAALLHIQMPNGCIGSVIESVVTK